MTTPKKIGFLVRDLSAGQLSFELIRRANDEVRADPSLDVVAFYEAISRPVAVPLFAQMPLSEAYAYNGHLVATTLSTAARLLRFPSALSRNFYVWDLEWARSERKDYRSLQAVYGDPRLRLVARSESHRTLLEDMWCRPVAAVVDDFDFSGFFRLFWGDECKAG